MAKIAFKNKVLPSVMAATLASGMTLSGNANAIHLADNGIGQTLLGPVYLVDFGYTTKVSIVNTRDDIAVKAKVVIRSAKYGMELLDFLCYLSPADVCRFEIREQDIDGDGDMEVVMYSDDDSIKSPVPNNVTHLDLVNSMEKSRATFASIRRVTQEVFTYKLNLDDPEDTERMGHIEVIGVYGVRGKVTGYATPKSGQDPKPISITVTRGMSKFALAQIFDTPRYPIASNMLDDFWQPIIPLDSANPPTELTERTTGAKAPYSPLTASRIRSTDPSWIQLTGEVELVSPIDRIGYRFAALAGSVGDNVPVVSGNVPPYSVPTGLPETAAIWDGLVVSNPQFDASIAKETGIGVDFGIDQFVVKADKTVEIEAALATTHIIDTFEDTSRATHDLLGKRTRMLVTFPTRYRHVQNLCNSGGAGPYSSPFQSGGAANYTLTALNNFEQTPGTPEIVITGTPFSGGKVEQQQQDEDPLIKGLTEVNYFIPDWPETEVDENGDVLHNVIDFRSGWFDMELLPRDGCGNFYPGIPALGFTHKYVDTGAGYTQSWFVSAGHKPVLCCDTKNGTDSCPSTSW